MSFMIARRPMSRWIPAILTGCSMMACTAPAREAETPKAAPLGLVEMAPQLTSRQLPEMAADFEAYQASEAQAMRLREFVEQETPYFSMRLAAMTQKRFCELDIPPAESENCQLLFVPHVGAHAVGAPDFAGRGRILGYITNMGTQDETKLGIPAGRTAYWLARKAKNQGGGNGTTPDKWVGESIIFHFQKVAGKLTIVVDKKLTFRNCQHYVLNQPAGTTAAFRECGHQGGWPPWIPCGTDCCVAE
jgi:hypothetical protein